MAQWLTVKEVRISFTIERLAKMQLKHIIVFKLHYRQIILIKDVIDLHTSLLISEKLQSRPQKQENQNSVL